MMADTTHCGLQANRSAKTRRCTHRASCVRAKPHGDKSSSHRNGSPSTRASRNAGIRVPGIVWGALNVIDPDDAAGELDGDGLAEHYHSSFGKPASGPCIVVRHVVR